MLEPAHATLAANDDPDVLIRLFNETFYEAENTVLEHADGEAVPERPACEQARRKDRPWNSRPTANYPPGYREVCDECEAMVDGDAREATDRWLFGSVYPGMQLHVPERVVR